MTNNKVISEIRIALKELSDDSNYSDQFLLQKALESRAEILAQKLSDNKYISEFNYSSFCVELERDKFYDCDCVSVGCDVLKSVHIIPSVLTSNSKMLLQIMSLDGKTYSYATPEQVKEAKYSKTKANNIFWYIQNGRIVIFNTLRKKAVYVKGLFEDPSAITALCDSTGVDCSDIRDNEFPFDLKYMNLLIDLSLKQLGFSKQIKNDEINNSRDNNG